MLVTAITPAAVRSWHANLKTPTAPTMRAHAYGLLRTIMNTAVADDVIAPNPCRVRGAGQSKRARRIQPGHARRARGDRRGAVPAGTG